ncbi:MAG TPA: trigger factor, partial [Dissulfurispiraceae bacterium]|nr:trigger factor [Dissulfurispiraceae bacterium]
LELLKALEDISSTKKRLKIEIPAGPIEAEIKKGLIDAQKKAKFPGFRPGKAPMSLVEKKFSKDVEAEVLEKIVSEFYFQAVREAGIKPVSRPSLEGSLDFRRNSDLSMTMTVEVMPKIENLTYENITVRGVPVEITDEEINTVMGNLADERATYEASDSPIQTGDLVTIDYTVREDQGSVKDVVLKVGSGSYPKEFFDGLQGLRKDEEVEIEAAFPEDMQSPYAGKKHTFIIRVREVKKKMLPALDDEFAKDIGLENLEQVKEKVRENLLNARNSQAEKTMQREILDKLVDAHMFEIPESMLNHELTGIISEMRASGKDDRSDEALRQAFRPGAEKSVKANLLMDMIGEKEGTTVSEDEVRDEIAAMARRFNITPENVIKYYVTKDGSLEGIRHSLFVRKVLALLLARAKIEKEAGAEPKGE